MPVFKNVSFVEVMSECPSPMHTQSCSTLSSFKSSSLFWFVLGDELYHIQYYLPVA